MPRKTPPEFSVCIERLVFGGEALGHFDGRPVFVYGALPDEVVTVAPLKVSGKYIKARLLSIQEPSPWRRQAREDHYLTCSPWQTLAYEEQVRQKTTSVKEMWGHMSGSTPELVDFLRPPAEWEYRNKLEFSVIENEKGNMQLAFHKRFRHNQYYAFDSCVLGMPGLNQAATNILHALEQKDWQAHDIKNILVRSSVSTNQTIAVVYTTTKQPKEYVLSVDGVSEIGYVYSDPRSPAAVTTEALIQSGELVLNEEIAGTDLMYGYDSFFQIYPAAFSHVLQRIQQHFDVNSLGTVLDLYAGVGTIGLAFAQKAEQVIAIESHPQAQYFAEKNAVHNRCDNFQMIVNPVESQADLSEQLRGATTLFVDPPRAGLVPRVAETIANDGPLNFVYISCNPATQCRDWKILQNKYMIEKWFLADMYPNTPHVESIIIATLK